jgi:hypothetical protein
MGTDPKKIKSRAVCRPPSPEKQHSLRAGEHETKHPIDKMTVRQNLMAINLREHIQKNNRLMVSFRLHLFILRDYLHVKHDVYSKIKHEHVSIRKI